MGKAKVIGIGLTGLKEVEVLVYMDHNEIDASYIKGIKKLTRFADATIASWLHISPRTLRSYKPETLFDKAGRLRHSRNPQHREVRTRKSERD